MILFLECIAACIIFGAAIVGSALINKTAWLHEYAPEVQKRFLEKNPDFKPKEKSRKMITLIIAKLTACAVFIAILSLLVHIAGADSFFTGFLYSYIIWFSVNLFDVIVLDIGIFAHWKKVRLAGTEDMDKEYRSNAVKSIKDGFFGIVIGLPAALICGLITTLNIIK